MLRKKSKAWLHGLLSATVAGVASGIVMNLADPKDFNLSDRAAILRLVSVCVGLGLSHAGAYLAKSPVPELGDE